jgi:hypothetical protein
MKWNANKLVKLIFEMCYGHLMISLASGALLFCHQATTVSDTKCGGGTPVQSDCGTVALVTRVTGQFANWPEAAICYCIYVLFFPSNTEIRRSEIMST